MDREQDKIRDANLVEAGLLGDRQALEQLVELYYKPVYNVAYRMLNDRDTAADATQTTFLLAFEKLGNFNPEYKFFSWIYRIAINEALDQGKKRQRFVQEDPQEKLLSVTVGPEQDLNHDETATLIQGALAGLQEDYRTVMILRHFSELSYDEIAGVLDIPVKTVRSRLYSARQVLKSELSTLRVFPNE